MVPRPLVAVLLPTMVLLPAGRSFAGDVAEPPRTLGRDIHMQPRRFDIREYGGKNDGVTLNTDAFLAAVSAIKAAGGGELYVPPGVWLTTGFALTSHMSLFLEHGSTLLGAPPNNTRWRPRNDSCSSYPRRYPPDCRGGPDHTEDRGTGVDERHSGYEPIVGGWNITDVTITGNNGTIAGQAELWWGGRWKHGRPHAVLFYGASGWWSPTSRSKTAPFGRCGFGRRRRSALATSPLLPQDMCTTTMVRRTSPWFLCRLQHIVACCWFSLV